MSPIYQYAMAKAAGIISAPTNTDPGVAQAYAKAGDENAYKITDEDFKKRFPQLAAGLTTYADNASSALSAPSTGLSLNGDVQNQFIKSGLSRALKTLGPSNLANLQDGGAGQAQVGKNLGLDLLDFQQKNIAAKQQQDQFKNAQFASALQIDPQRQIGLGGNAMANIYANNTAAQNAYQSGLGSSILSGMNNIAASNAQNSGNSSNALMGAGISAIGSVASVAAFACWVAREVYGRQNIKWVMFREYMLHHSPSWFRWSYLKFGEKLCKFISDKPAIKAVVKHLMDAKISSFYAHQGNKLSPA